MKSFKISLEQHLWKSLGLEPASVFRLGFSVRRSTKWAVPIPSVKTLGNWAHVSIHPWLFSQMLYQLSCSHPWSCVPVGERLAFFKDKPCLERASAFNAILQQPARWPVKTDHDQQTHQVPVSTIIATTTTKIFFLKQLGWIQNLKINTPVKTIKTSYLISAISLCLLDTRGI